MEPMERLAGKEKTKTLIAGSNPLEVVCVTVKMQRVVVLLCYFGIKFIDLN